MYLLFGLKYHHVTFLLIGVFSVIMTWQLVIRESESPWPIVLVDSDFMNDDFLGRYPILNFELHLLFCFSFSVK